jgi:lysophospholipase L1-like esterase
MGDSITANGGGVSNGNMFWGSTSWVYQAAMASGGRMVLIKNVAHTGDLCDTQLALFDAQVTPLHPDKVVLMCGTNDLTANHTVPTIIASITAIVNKALAIGAVPILNTIPPKTASPGSVIPLNMAIVALARTLKVPVFDHYPLIVGTDGAYRSGYSGDGTHPTAATAQIMGSAWWTAMSSYYPAASSIFLPTMAGASTSWVVNPLFTTTQTITCNSVQVTIPTLWGSCGYTATPAVYPTFALTTNDTTINGNWWSITVPAMSGGLWMGSNANYTTGFTTGDCLMLSGRLKLSNVVASAGGQFGIAFGDGQAFMPSWASDITNGVFYFLYVVKSTDTVIKLNFAVNPGPSAAVTASVAQWGVVNLTTLGLAPNGCTL